MALATRQPAIRAHQKVKPVSIKKSGYRPEIDGLRALAVIAVIVYHFNPELLPSGFLGVDIFFVISGFVVTSSLTGKPDQSWSDYLLKFYARRVKRLIPALVFCVAITSLFGCLFIDVDLTRDSLRTGISSLFGLSNLYILRQNTDYFGQSADLNLFTQTWSLGVEEQFYMTFPILLGLCGYSCQKRQNGPKILYYAVLTLSVLSLAGYLFLSVVQPDAAFFLMPARFWELGAGCLMFLAVTRFAHADRLNDYLPPAATAQDAMRFSPSALIRLRMNQTKAVVAIAGTLLLIGLLFIAKDFQTVSTLTTVVVTCLLLWSFELKSLPVRLLSSSWLVKIGLLSYSLYLWHWSVLVISRWTIGISKWTIPLQLVAMVVLALISNNWVEKPLRYASWSGKQVRTILYGLVATVSSAVWLAALDNPLRGKLYTGVQYSDAYVSSFPSIEEYEPCSDAATTDLSNCFYPQVDSQTVGTTAATEVSRSPQTVYFVGDSHTGSLQSLASELIEQEDVPRIMMVERDGCLFSTKLMRADEDSAACLDSNRSFLSHVLEKGSPGDVVVITSRHTLYFLLPNSPDDIAKLEKGMFSLSYDGEVLSKSEALEKYTQDLKNISEQLAAKDIELVIKAPLPDWKHKPSQCHPQWFRPDFNLPADCDLNVAAESRSRLNLLQVFRQLETKIPNIHVYDPFPEFCNSERCSPFSREGVPLFRDSDHLNNYGAKYIYVDFVQYLKAQSLITQK